MELPFSHDFKILKEYLKNRGMNNISGYASPWDKVIDARVLHDLEKIQGSVSMVMQNIIKFTKGRIPTNKDLLDFYLANKELIMKHPIIFPHIHRLDGYPRLSSSAFLLVESYLIKKSYIEDNPYSMMVSRNMT